MKDDNYIEYSDIDLLVIVSMYEDEPSEAIDAFEIFLSRYNNFIYSTTINVISKLNNHVELIKGTIHNTIFHLFYRASEISEYIEGLGTKLVISRLLSFELAQLLLNSDFQYLQHLNNTQRKTHILKKDVSLKHLDNICKNLTKKELQILFSYIFVLRFNDTIGQAINLNNLAKSCYTTRINLIATLNRIKSTIINQDNNKMTMDEIILHNWNEPLVTSGVVFPDSEEEISIFAKEVLVYQRKSQETIDLLEVLSKGKYVVKRTLPKDIELKIAARGENDFLDDELKNEILENIRKIKSQNEDNDN